MYCGAHIHVGIPFIALGDKVFSNYLFSSMNKLSQLCDRINDMSHS